MKQLFCDCKADVEKANFFLSGRAVETGIIASAISNDVAMAYHRCAEFQNEIDALRAMIAEMERQKPAYWGPKNAIEGGSTTVIVGKFRVNPTDAPLYALPGAQTQPAPSINEGVRKVTLGFRWESEAQHHIPTIEIEFDPVSPDSPNDAKGWQDRDRIASMLSPEAKP